MNETQLSAVVVNDIVITGLSNINATAHFHYLVYRITNINTGKYYVGQHGTADPFDAYMGSGTYIQNALSADGISCFTKEILHDFKTFEEMDKKEQELVQLSNCYPYDKLSYNLKPGGCGINDVRRENNKNDSAARCWVNDGKISKFVKATDIPNGFSLGRIVTDKMRQHNKQVGHHKSHRNNGKIVVNNGISNKYVLPDQIPDGYKRGSISKSSLGKIWINDGKTQTQQYKNLPLPFGFRIGRLPNKQHKID